MKKFGVTPEHIEFTYTNTREALAGYAHEAWSGWMRYLFGVCADAMGAPLNEDGSVTIPADKVQRWMRQAATPYAELPESEKGSDREEADKILAAIGGLHGQEVHGSQEG